MKNKKGLVTLLLFLVGVSRSFAIPIIFPGCGTSKVIGATIYVYCWKTTGGTCLSLTSVPGSNITDAEYFGCDGGYWKKLVHWNSPLVDESDPEVTVIMFDEE